MLKRIVLNLILFFSVLFAPWWAPVIFALFLLFYFNNFIEILFVGLIVDLLYGNGQFYFIVGSIAVFVIVYIFKKKVRYYK